MAPGRWPIKSLRARLFAGAAAAACSALPAMAQTPAATAPVTSAQPPSPINLEAEVVSRSPQGVVTAEGQVEGRYKDRSLRARELSYDEANHVISGRDVTIVDDLGNAEWARSMTFNEDLNSGVAQGFAAQQGQAKFAADSAIRYSQNLNELNRAIFTPCDICRQDGSPKEPTWSVSADQIVQDRDKKLVFYRNAVIRVKGVPIFWTPLFWHADPQADYVSGLLAPRFQQTRRRGFSYEQPYLWAISPYQDLVLSPQFNTEVAPFLNGEWRKRFYSGMIDARFGYTYDQDFNSGGLKFGDDRTKAYVLASGAFKPDSDWTWGFSAERVQDKLLFDEYSIRQIYRTRGIFLSDDRRLLSQLYAVRQDQRSYLSVAMLSFQSLRPLVNLPANAFGIRPFEDDDTLPEVAPLIEGRYEPQGPILGGRLRLRGGGVLLTRKESTLANGLGSGQPGIDSGRATLEADWRSSMTFSSGLRVEPFADVRGDYYRVTDLTAQTDTTSRFLPTVGIDFSLPFVRSFGRTGVILEPIVQIALSPDPKVYPDIPNEDSLAFDFNDTNLFDYNRSPGFDLYEGGQRMNVGLRASADWGGGHDVQLVVGQSFRREADPNIPARSGLRGRSSDYIIAAEARPITGVSFYTKARLDDRTLDVHRIEFGADLTTDRVSGHVRYLREDEDFAGVFREDVEVQGDAFLTAHWGVSVNAIDDLATSTWRKKTAGIVYRDECTRLDVIYERNERPVLGGRSSDSIMVRLSLAINGDARYRSQGADWSD
jgi:LPS-assembly protein